MGRTTISMKTMKLMAIKPLLMPVCTASRAQGTTEWFPAGLAQTWRAPPRRCRRAVGRNPPRLAPPAAFAPALVGCRAVLVGALGTTGASLAGGGAGRSFTTTATLTFMTPPAGVAYMAHGAVDFEVAGGAAAEFAAESALAFVAASTWVALVVVGQAGGVLAKAPGTPSAARLAARSSARTSERVRGPLSRLSKSSVVLSIWVKSSDKFTCERTLASPTMGDRICMMRLR
jgi:hypothetical protein